MTRAKPFLFLIAMSLGLAGLFVRPAFAFDTTAQYGVLIDGPTGAVLWEKDGDVQMHPASMSKLMTLSLLFDALKAGTVKLTDEFPISEHAWRAGGTTSGSSTMFAQVGSRIPVETLIQGIIVQSGNDACIAVAEALKGSEPEFAIAMTKRGKELGLANSTFANATGWPDPNQMMTAHDLARLARHIIYDFPEYYHFFSEKEFTWNGITQHNRNPALFLDPSVDGLKTGHTEASGYGLVVSAKRGDERLILVLNGMPTEKARAEEAVRVLDWGFRSFKSYKLFAAGAAVDNAPVYQGVYSQVPLVATSDIDIIMTPDQRKEMKVSVSYSAPVVAPVAAGQRIGTLKIEIPDKPVQEVPLVAGGNVDRLGIFGRAFAAIHHMIFGG
ncbi:MAG: D-alanyl-D-alanine carboxypeptidase [Parvibaculum sp.]|jgi:D-alanyl-D-alanine carboxypeptidase (penicillin-binding protein 5/6)|uniref:D-alanyl-D-alanine carboxypeptidase family protein n=1 Tax=Parvibaculum sp. TaxID=2024848 RepID=UPI00283F9F66|nr:D-alanyl-D-alanine carboxypeptidase family protein [Parvibaculum sp.]MDR3498624.1 D-alanyl-D-alanine carboxypeptidase [Parvibaculum sp.]